MLSQLKSIVQHLDCACHLDCAAIYAFDNGRMCRRRFVYGAVNWNSVNTHTKAPPTDATDVECVSGGAVQMSTCCLQIDQLY